MVVTKNYQSTLHTDRDLSNFVISWFLEGNCSLPHLSVFNTSSFVKEKKWLHNSVLTPRSWTWLELDRRSNAQRTICVSYARIIFLASTEDNHTLPICTVATLHHAHPRPQTAIGLCIVPSEANVVPISSSISQFVSHHLSFEWIYAFHREIDPPINAGLTIIWIVFFLWKFSLLTCVNTFKTCL